MSKKKKKDKYISKARYSPIQNYLSREVVLGQAAFALDVATQKAIEEGNVEHILTASALWMELSNPFGPPKPVAEEPEAHEVLTQKFKTGFAAAEEVENGE